MPNIQKLLTIAILSTLAAAVAASEQIPGVLPKGPVAIVGATLHPVSADAIPKGTIVFEDGKITALGDKVKVPPKATIIKADGKHVYPGLFESRSRIGLVEIDAIKATRDFDESGLLNPNAKAHVSVDPDSEIIPVTRSNGVLLAMSSPAGGLIAGQSAVLQLDGWTFEELTLKPRTAMIVSMRSESDRKSLEKFFDKARHFAQAVAADVDVTHDERLSAMVDVIEGKQPIIIEADRWDAITRAVTFANEQNVKLILFGGYDAPKCAELLKTHDVPVIISAIHRKPLSRDDPYDASFTLPKRLQELGIRFSISGYDRSEGSNTRNLPYEAATAAAFGLSPENAIRAITLSPAEILGVADHVGSLEVGKDATLFLCDGNPLEAATHTEAAWIAGKPVDLDDKHKRLRQKYEQKYEQADD